MQREFPPLSAREWEILRQVIELHVISARPVGSGAVQRNLPYSLSSATIRNVMGRLAEKGYLVQPHPSAGRVPTELAYRYYARQISELAPLEEEVRVEIRQALHDPDLSLEAILDNAAELLSELTRCAGCVMITPLSASRLRHIDFVRLHGRRVLVVLTTDAGFVVRKEIVADEELSQEELDRCARYTNESFAGQRLSAIRRQLLRELVEERIRYDRMLRAVRALGAQAMENDEDAVLVMGRVTNILGQPEFARAAGEALRRIFRVFEEKRKIVRILNHCLKAGAVQVAIGTELPLPGLVEFSLIGSRCVRNDDVLGALAVFGPMRMPYRRIMALVDYTAGQLTSVISRAQELQP
jgi:heat-inducible transcriptional repressor